MPLKSFSALTFYISKILLVHICHCPQNWSGIGDEVNMEKAEV